VNNILQHLSYLSELFLGFQSLKACLSALALRAIEDFVDMA
jgi:hypothetical protein